MSSIVETAIGLNLIADIIDRVQQKTGTAITPENIAAYVAERKQRRAELNAQLGVAGGEQAGG
ncbi:MAG: hypothetical protein M0036_05015 [Desulfobacteraceae bacterium]|nr:hypothetical protein [Desulfobacteraceae bacterium]